MAGFQSGVRFIYMFKKAKQLLKKAISSKPITYTAPKRMERPKRRPVTPHRGGLKQYGEKGYRPSNGKGVGY